MNDPCEGSEDNCQSIWIGKEFYDLRFIVPLACFEELEKFRTSIGMSGSHPGGFVISVESL